MADETSFADLLAKVCFGATNLILDPVAPPAESETDPEPRWAYERRMWNDAKGTAEPMDWVAEATSLYLIEGAHQLRAIGVLLGTGVVTASLDPLVRAVVERAGRVKWILSPDITPEQRGARAGLEWGVSMSAYRQTLARLKAPNATQKEWQKRVRRHRELLDELFDLDIPPDDPCNDESDPTTDMARWVVAGEAYPNYGTNAGYALETEHVSNMQGKAMYDGLSGFSHPSVIFSREHRAIAENGAVTYTYQPSDLEKSVRAAALGLLDAFRYWTTYYGAAPDVVQQHIDELGDFVDGASVIQTESQE